MLTFDRALDRFDVHLLSEPGHPMDGLWVIIDEDAGILVATASEDLAHHFRWVLINNFMNPIKLEVS